MNNSEGTFKARNHMHPKLNLKALTSQQVASFFHNAGLPLFRARQLLHWMYERYAQSIGDITEFSQALRKRLSERSFISVLTLLKRQTSEDGTEKFLFALEDGESIESVLIPDKGRLTLCISSQVGCNMGCLFCLTGTLGFKRNLKAYEIVDQCITVSRIIAPERITNIVFMGMGEPLLNFDEVVDSLQRMTDLMKISKRRITLSTAGIVPRILELGGAGRSMAKTGPTPHMGAPRVNLAISLNATTDRVRDMLMPINKIYPLKSLIDACRIFPLEPRRRITFEYVMLNGINDSAADARRLITLLTGIPSKVNLIPFNPYEGCGFRRPSDETVLTFQKILLDARMTTLIRKSKGQDILAACGQLKAGYP
ncbi:MAG TPA: 23S rRNA (adenine(2503)-C(2))-methyltransferase RlmN [Thermodesulfovibrionales bacterium]|nr:23S rRNA (adenine(2503)-C(2))-methyltransferase RlmN [Thermodesulfovibrionales bacterium]